MLKKEEVYVEARTKKQAKKLKKVLEMFGESKCKVTFKDFEDFTAGWITNKKETTCVVFFFKKWIGSWVNFHNGLTQVSIKELRNILAVEHLKEGDFVVYGINGSDSKYIVEFEKFNGDHLFGKRYVTLYSSGGNSDVMKGGAFTNFIRYATEEEKELLNPKPKELEVGKWYKHTSGSIACYQGIKTQTCGINESYENEPFFYSTNWFRDDNIQFWQEATHEEVKEALIKEAKHRGLVEGAVCNNSNIHGFKVKDNVIEDFGGYEFNIEKNELRVLDKNEVDTWYTIFKDGKWAEVVKSAETAKTWTINFSKQNPLTLDIEVEINLKQALITELEELLTELKNK